jgi:hypothetical protein
MRRTISFLVRRMGGEVLFYDQEREKKTVLQLIRQIREEVPLLLAHNEAYAIFTAVEITSKLTGDIAEVGVLAGGSAKLICEAKGDRVLHLFDTFEGLPEVGEHDPGFEKGWLRAPFESTQAYLSRYPGVRIYKGLFPKTAAPIKNVRFSFVHLDADLYQSTLESLKFFYPRMNRGG